MSEGPPDTATIAGWLDAFAARTGAPPPTADELRDLLDLARHAAHRSQRQAAPIACWIAGRSGLPVADALALVEADPTLRAPEADGDDAPR
ncbi:DUF6457 domain-containing protein [Patulibacter defluvii]|uniref:DUF6457 domain-containing protein n=1 Tax=Patulibacter defluvii TaxID=3095358 RepID=UPI002A752897|nr:DUF6457 domain-containing protein [Patulibacter sp. DM4]